MPGTVREAGLNFGEHFLRWFSCCVVRLVHRPKLYGPKPVLDEPTIFACRHVGLMDPVMLMVVYSRMMVRPLIAKDYYSKNRFTRWFYHLAQCIPLDRYGTSKQWIEDAMASLARGESVIIFPEGKRNKTGEGLLPFHNGVALLAERSGARIVPVYNAVWHFPRRYQLAIGEPYYLETPRDGVRNSDWLNKQTQIIQDSVAALAPKLENK